MALVLCATLACGAFAATANDAAAARLDDGADILTAVEEEELLEKLDRISEEYKVDVAIATVNGTGDMDATEYVNYYFDNSTLGFGEGRDAVLFLIDMDARQFRILSNGKDLGAVAVSSDDIESITDKVSSDLKRGNYAAAFHTFADECEYQIDGEINGFPFKAGRNLIISLIIGLIVSLIVTGSMKGKLKSVRWQDKATSYVKNGSFNVTESRDIFLYSRINRTKRQKEDSNSGDSTPSRNVGGGSF